MNDAIAICRRNTEIAKARAMQVVADPAPDYRAKDVEQIRMAILLINQSQTPYRRDFPSYLADNFHVFKAFEREADKIWNRGRRHYSGRTIIEVLRHESALADRWLSTANKAAIGKTWKEDQPQGAT